MGFPSTASCPNAWSVVWRRETTRGLEAVAADLVTVWGRLRGARAKVAD